MREINVEEITIAVAELAVETNHHLSSDVCSRINGCREEETWPVAKNVLEKIEENIDIAQQGIFPLCQDTGMACVFLEIGQDVHLIGGNLEEAINKGVRKGYGEGYLRKSVVKDPIRRGNTGDNTPAHIHYEIVPGEQVKIVFAPKGFGSENMSQIKMFPPAAGEKGVKDFVVQVVKEAGANPCPPIVVGVGIGGTFDRAALMAKEALLIPFDEPNPDDYYNEMEKELLERINALGIGPQGLGGKTTALAVKIKTYPTHIAGMPVAVNINCHVSRHAERVL
ncbi:fumarate hydratase [Clostridium aminobutyricum]|uniref:Fumarate hydratase n=1 Tax=Clostridium aminobutyricum TaxID=33953 RepID=A0A939IJB2_CLOAM|nr:fumarate hydratase [Clostridium aminobutyricum]MBN7773399.1 fumarate hydratase [Clostridium aminobutyricum]